MSSEVAQKVEQVNALLLSGEPGNISTDEHSGYTGYKPQALVDAMNDGFGIGGWGFEEVSSEIIPAEKGGLAIAQVQVWLKGIEFKPTSWGQNRVTRGDVGDAKKGAQTDAIKKALSYFSIGNRAYHGLLKEQNGTNAHPVPPKAQPLRNGDGTPAVKQPTSTINAPLPSQLRKRVAAMKLNDSFEAIVLKVLKLNKPDDNLTPEDCNQIKLMLDAVDAKRAAKGAA